MCFIEVPRGNEKNIESILEDNSQTLCKLVKDKHLYIQAPQQISRRINSDIHNNDFHIKTRYNQAIKS